MSDPSPTFELLRWVSIALYFAIAGGALYWAYKRPPSARAKSIRVVVALALLGILPGGYALRAMEQQRSRMEFEKYRDAAWAHFRKRCEESAGESIYHTVNDVESVLLLKPRREATESDLRDQYWRGDPYGNDSILPDTEVRNYLRYLDKNNLPVVRKTSRPGYRFVEVREQEGVFRHFELSKDGAKVNETTIAKPRSDYAVTWTDISTGEDRKFWVAGGRLEVIERATGNVLGKRVGYLIEPGFGSQRNGRRPWLHARLISSERAACPAFPAKGFWPINRLFVEKILRPITRGSDGQ